MTIKTIVQEASALEAELNAELPVPAGIDQFCQYWPTVKKILEFAKVFTGKKADRAIDVIIEWGNRICPQANR
jgi:hypothetical protein